MIELKNVSFHYANADEASLRDVSLHIRRGECVLLCGQSGCGKTTLTRLINGLVPHYYEGELRGGVRVGDLEVPKAELYDIAHMVGSVFQNPRSQFFCVDTTGELAFGCENLGMPAAEIEARVQRAARELRAGALLGRSIFQLSGGEKQKIACASVSAMQPEVFVLDEPTSNLDIRAIGDLGDTIRQWKQQGKTVVIAEHRLHWLTEICDRVVYLRSGKIEYDMTMREFCRLPGERLRELGLRALGLTQLRGREEKTRTTEEIVLKNYRFSYQRGAVPNLDIGEVALPKDGVVAIVGHNGAGKSTLSKCLCGLQRRFNGVCCCGAERCGGRKMLKKSYLVMQDVNHQLFCESVEEELRLGMAAGNETELVRVMNALELTDLRERHPMSLSGGQKQRVAIASALLAGKEIFVFDEPTSGLDFYNMEKTAALFSDLGRERTVFIVTHDPELIVRCCDYVLHLEEGRVADQYTLNAAGQKKLRNFFEREERTEIHSEQGESKDAGAVFLSL
jgi:energy-coupling factor transporter ATP-binding protein EcfA2